MGDNAPGRPLGDAVTQERATSPSALAGLLAESAAADPDRVAFRDQPGREAWSGRPSSDITCAAAWESVRRLSGYLARLGLLPGSSVGLCLANGSEACLAILAVLEAGLTPCLLNVTWTASEVSTAIEAADIRAIITQGVIGAERPAEKFCFVAAGFFRLRFLLAFGPSVPNGVTDLDRVLAETRRGRDDLRREPGRGADGAGIVTFPRTALSRPVFRQEASLLAATATYLRAAKLKLGDRVISLLPPDDLKGLATGLAATLLTGATLEAHGLFESGTFGRALEAGERPHVILPGWIETALVDDDILSLVASAILIHDAPTSFTTRALRGGRLVDVVSFGEAALLAGARTEPGRFGIDLEREVGSGATRLLEVRIKDGGEICFRGPARVLQNDCREGEDGFAPSGFRVATVGSVVVGVS